MCELIKSLFANFPSVSVTNSTKDETKLFKERVKYSKKNDKEYHKHDYERIFADADVNELKLLDKLSLNNDWIEISDNGYDIDDLDRRMVQDKKTHIDEHLYQIVEIEDKEPDAYYGGNYREEKKYKIRITCPVYKEFVKKFKANGKERLKGI